MTCEEFRTGDSNAAILQKTRAWRALAFDHYVVCASCRTWADSVIKNTTKEEHAAAVRDTEDPEFEEVAYRNKK